MYSWYFLEDKTQIRWFGRIRQTQAVWAEGTEVAVCLQCYDIGLLESETLFQKAIYFH